MKKPNKYTYTAVIQQFYGQVWEDVSEYETDSTGNCKEKTEVNVLQKNGTTHKIFRSLLTHDLKEYRLTDYPTRVIHRKELNQELTTV